MHEFSGCEIDLRAWGMEDPPPVIGWIKVNGEIQVELSQRGMNVLLLKQHPELGCEVIQDSLRQFDTYEDVDGAARFREYIEQQPGGTVVLVATADEVTGGDCSDRGELYIQWNCKINVVF